MSKDGKNEVATGIPARLKRWYLDTWRSGDGGKAKILALWIGALALIGAVEEAAEDKYLAGVEAIDHKSYQTAQRKFEQVKPSDPHYAQAREYLTTTLPRLIAQEADARARAVAEKARKGSLNIEFSRLKERWNEIAPEPAFQLAGDWQNGNDDDTKTIRNTNMAFALAAKRNKGGFVTDLIYLATPAQDADARRSGQIMVASFSTLLQLCAPDATPSDKRSILNALGIGPDRSLFGSRSEGAQSVTFDGVAFNANTHPTLIVSCGKS